MSGSGKRPLRLGMIGCGQISTRFFNQAEALNALGWDVRFVATCARTEASASAKALNATVPAGTPITGSCLPILKLMRS